MNKDLIEITDEKILQKYYETYKQRAKDGMVDSYSNFVKFAKTGKVLTDYNYIALFIPAEEFCLVFYLLNLYAIYPNPYKNKEVLKKFFDKCYDYFKKPLVGFDKTETVFYYDTKLLITYNERRNPKILIKKVKEVI